MDVCPACGAVVDPSARTCPTCGTRLAEPTASFEPVPAGQEPVGLDATVVAGAPALVVRKGIEVGERFYLDRQRLTVGRDPASDIFLNDVTVSRRHAVITVSADGVTIEDQGSLNGTYVNDVRVDAARLSHGDVVQIGRFQLLFVSQGGV